MRSRSILFGVALLVGCSGKAIHNQAETLRSDDDLKQGGRIPEDLDWSQNVEMIPVTMCAAVGVVEQRHYTLNWLVNFLNPEDWDHVDTPT